ncbi:M56 family metallopeptidase [Flavobacterium sp. RSB2_4_14]|uniref:M56 family metallopeptidase n=1 Tax=Flavobacterium sp. RSB2_4_14 TaxID=3447665 RepID=UPI003F2EC953
METLFIYLLKSSGLIAVFYLAYHFLVRKETFFTSNRWFLITGLFTSLLLPLFTITKVIYVERPKVVLQEIVPYTNSSTITQNIAPVETFDWVQLIWMSYILIASLLAIKIVLNFISLYRILHQQQITKKEQFKLINLNENIAPFSFFNYIVYNADLYSNEELQSILLHEKIHSKEKHSFDVMIAKLFCIIFWFNPFVWLYKKAITQNLEYIADQKAIQQLEDKKSYQRALLKVVSNQNCLSITNNFYQSLIKKRIVMLNKNQSHKRSSWKYSLVIPALIAFVILFQIKTIAQEKETKNSPGIIETHEGGDITFDATESDKSLSTLKNVFKEEKITTDISKIKRNSAGEITGICIKMKCEDGRKKELKINQSTPIDKIFIYTNRLENGSYDFGVKHLANDEISAVRNKIDRKRHGIYISKNGEDAYAFNFNDSIPEMKDFNFDFEVPEAPEVPEVQPWKNTQKTSIIIKRDDKEPLVIVDGKIIEGGNDYTKEELEKIMQANNATIHGNKEFKSFNYNPKRDFSNQMKMVTIQKAKAQEEIAKSQNEIERAKPEMEKAKNEMIKAKAEMDAARAELEKAKAELKRKSGN